MSNRLRQAKLALVNLLREAAKLWRRKLPTESHKIMWKRYERILNLRANITFLSLAIMQILWHIRGHSRVKRSKEFLEGKGSDSMHDHVSDVLPFIDAGMLVVAIFGRLLLPVISIWKPQVCKAFWGVQMLVTSMKETAVIDFGDMWQQFMTTELVLHFALLSNCGHIDMIIGVLVQVYLHFGRAHLIKDIDEPFMETMRTFIPHALMVLIAWSLMHIFLTWIGFTFIDAELPRADNELLLNNMKEGVVIVDSQSGKTRFANFAAQDIGKELYRQCEFALLKDNELLSFDQKSCRFTWLDRHKHKDLSHEGALAAVTQQYSIRDQESQVQPPQSMGQIIIEHL